MNKGELIGKLQMVYVGDKNALNELICYYTILKRGIDELQQENQKYKEVIDKAIEYLDDWLFNVGGLGACMDYKDIKEILDILKEVE